MDNNISVMVDSERLKALRKQKKLKKVFVAEQMGITPAAYTMKETGKYQFKDSEKLILARLLDMNFEEFDDVLFGGELKNIKA